MWAFVFACYLVVLFQIIVDLFRDENLSGWWKAVWIVFLIIVPFLSVLIYVIARGKGMAERHRLQRVPGKRIPTCRRPSSTCLLQLIRSPQLRRCSTRERSLRPSLIS